MSTVGGNVYEAGRRPKPAAAGQKITWLPWLSRGPKVAGRGA